MAKAKEVLARWKANTVCPWCDGSHTASDCPLLNCDRWQQDAFGTDSEPESDDGMASDGDDAASGDEYGEHCLSGVESDEDVADVL